MYKAARILFQGAEVLANTLHAWAADLKNATVRIGKK